MVGLDVQQVPLGVEAQVVADRDPDHAAAAVLPEIADEGRDLAALAHACTVAWAGWREQKT